MSLIESFFIQIIGDCILLNYIIMENHYEQGKDYFKEFSYKPGIHTPNIEEVTFLMKAMLSEMEWLMEIVDARIDELNNQQENVSFIFSQHTAPHLDDNNSAYAQLVKELELTPAERLLLICSIMPHFAPEKLTHILREKENHSRTKYPEFGGYIDLIHTNYVPTIQTVLFLLSGNDKTNAVFYKMAISNTGKLVREGIINLTPMQAELSRSFNELQFVPQLTQEYLLYLQSGFQPRPDFGKAFPATWVTTGLDWEHLILDAQTRDSVEHIMLWVKHGEALIESNPMFNSSFPCLFYGPSGTGKSLTAKLIGKKYNKDVFRVDLSMIVSKYIGETEKNLAHLFDRAAGKDWILFFDEADALFGKRTSVSSAQDKWANLEMSYLLQRMEEHKGLTILASNLKDNIDSAMTRRFQSIIYFPEPKEKEREQLWGSLLPSPYTYEKGISPKIMSKYKFTGANIANILKYACLHAVHNNTHEIKTSWLQEGIRKEFIKENRTP